MDARIVKLSTAGYLKRNCVTDLKRQSSINVKTSALFLSTLEYLILKVINRRRIISNCSTIKLLSYWRMTSSCGNDLQPLLTMRHHHRGYLISSRSLSLCHWATFRNLRAIIQLKKDEAPSTLRQEMLRIVRS